MTFLSAAASSSIYSAVLVVVAEVAEPAVTVVIVIVTLKLKKSRDYNLSSVEAFSQPPEDAILAIFASAISVAFPISITPTST